MVVAARGVDVYACTLGVRSLRCTCQARVDLVVYTKDEGNVLFCLLKSLLHSAKRCIQSRAKAPRALPNQRTCRNMSWLTCPYCLGQRTAGTRLEQALSWLFQTKLLSRSAEPLCPSCLSLSAALHFLQRARDSHQVWLETPTNDPCS